MLEVAACLEEGPVLRAVPKGRVNPPPDHRQGDSHFDSNVHITRDSGYRTEIRVDKDGHLETP